MRLVLFIYILIGLTSQAFSQHFPTGTKWNFNEMSSNGLEYYDGPKYFENMGDTIFNGETLQYISGNGTCWATEDILIKAAGDKIYVLNDCDSTFSLLYDFGAIVGDKFKIYEGTCWHPDDYIEIEIDSIETITINSSSLKKFYYHTINTTSNLSFPGDIIEGIGNTHTLIPAIAVCDPWTHNLRCLDHPTIGYYNSGLYSNCDTIKTYPIDHIEESLTKNSITIYPHPIVDEINITSDSPITKILLTSISGQTINSYELEGVKNITLGPKLHTGIYLIHIATEDGSIIKPITKY